MNYKEKAKSELIWAIAHGKQDAVKMFSIGRNIIKSLPASESVKSIIDDQDIYIQFNQANVQYIASLSTDNDLVFFNTKEDKIILNREEKIVSYLYDEKSGRIVFKVMD